MFNQTEIAELLKVVDYQYTYMITASLGTNILTSEDVLLLNSFGINPYKAITGIAPYKQMFYLGRLVAVLKDADTKSLSYSNFHNYLTKKQFVPLSDREEKSFEVSQQKTYDYLKGLGSKAKTDISNIVYESNQKEIIKKELTSGVKNRNSIQQIISEIGHKTGTWHHDWKRVVATEMNNIFLQGKISVLIDTYGIEHKVYKEVYPQACRHCIKLHLTNGIGSKPILFTLKELIKNGSNIGKTVSEWKAGIESVHPYCRCHIISYFDGQIWDEDKKDFVYKRIDDPRITSKIKVTIDNKIFYV